MSRLERAVAKRLKRQQRNAVQYYAPSTLEGLRVLKSLRAAFGATVTKRWWLPTFLSAVGRYGAEL